MTKDALAEYGPADNVIDAPKVTIPAQPEMTMSGVVGLLQPTIMKCAMGGWMVVIPGQGVAAKSSLSEAIAFLEDHAYEFFAEARSEMPRFMAKTKVEDMAELHPKFWSIKGAANAAVAMLAIFMGVKLV
jgi:hypothetical protein